MSRDKNEELRELYTPKVCLCNHDYKCRLCTERDQLKSSNNYLVQAETARRLSSLLDVEVKQLEAKVKRLGEQAKYYPRVAGENIRLREEVVELEEKLLKAVDFIDFKHRPLFTAAETVLMNPISMKEDFRQLELALNYCKTVPIGSSLRTKKMMDDNRKKQRARLHNKF